MWRLTRIWDSIKATVFRLRYGFDKRDCWSLDLALAKWLAPRLRYLSEHARGCPCDPFLSFSNDDESIEKWKDQLAEAAKALESYKAEWDNPDSTSASVVEANERTRKAIQWVADHFEQLWD